MLLSEIGSSWQSTLEEIEELENRLFDNAFNATTLSSELRTGARCWIVGTEEVRGYILLREESGIVDILRVGVLPSYQGQGIGTSLMKVALQMSKRCMLCVRKYNQGAIRLYHQLGFIIVGDLGDSWIMTTFSSS